MSDSTGKRRGKTPKTKEASSATAVVAPQNTTTSTKKPLPATFKDPDNPEQSRPRYAAGTVIGGKKVGGQPMSDEVLKAARQGTQPAAQQSQQETTQQQEQPSQDRQPSRLQRIGATIARGARVAGALGPMGMIRSINRSAETNTSLFNFEGMDARNVAAARVAGMGGGYGGSQTALSPRAERAVISTSSDMAAVRVSLGRIERSVVGISDKIGADTTIKAGASKPREGGEAGGGGIMGLIGSLFGGLGNLFGGGGGAGIGALLRRSIGAIARAIFTKIPIIGPLILVALNIEGAMEEYEKNGLGAAITDLLSGIGSDLTFGLIDKDTIKKFINDGVAKVTEWWNSAKAGFTNIVDGVYEAVKGFVDTIKRTISNILSFIPGGRALARLLGLPDIERPPAPEDTEPPTSQDVVRESYGPGQEEEYGRVVQNVLMNPRPNETDEQRAERERLNALQREMEGQTRLGEATRLAPGVSEFISRTANIPTQVQAERARSEEAAAISGEAGAEPIPQRAETQTQTLSGSFQITPATRRSNPEAISLIEQAASQMNIRNPRGGVIENGRVVSIIPSRGQPIQVPLESTTPQQVTTQVEPISGVDTRSQAMSQGTGQQAPVMVPVPIPQAQQPAPVMQQSQGGGGAAAVGGAGTPPTTFPTTFSDPVSPAMVGNR